MRLNWKKIKTTIWYRQKTHSLASFVLGPGMAVIKLLNAGQEIFFYTNATEFRGYFDEDFMRSLAEKEIKKFRKDGNYLHRLHNNWLNKARALENEINRIRKINLEKLSNDQLLNLNKSFSLKAQNIWLVPFFLDIFDPNAEDFIGEEIAKSKISLTQEEINTLTLPSRPSMAQEYHKEILNHLVGHDPNINAILQKFYFIKCSYTNGQVLALKELRQDLSHAKEQSLLNGQLTGLRQYFKNTQLKKRTILRKKNLPVTLKNLFGFFAELSQWRDERKTLVQKTVTIVDRLGREIARRSKLPYRQVTLCLPYEINSIPVSRKLIGKWKKTLQKNFLNYSLGKGKIKFIGNRTCKKLLALLEPKHNGQKQVTGQIACKGKAKGPAKIIHGEKDFHKFKAGDILITSMTRPEFLPLMKKAKAIITDEGGITSHAAIISRELNIPCIIGAKIASKIFKDNDIIRVDANKGVANKL